MDAPRRRFVASPVRANDAMFLANLERQRPLIVAANRATMSHLLKFLPNLKGWQEWRGSNSQPPVLETGALPIELHS